MSAPEAAFFFFLILAAVAAGAILFSRNVFKSALCLLVCLLSVAALYVLSFAELLAVAQILVYAGGILVIIIFGIMLTTKLSGRPLIVKHTHTLTGGFTGVALFVLLLQYLPVSAPANSRLQPEELNKIALVIFSEYTVPFEIAGLLLLVALVGAAVVTSNLKSES